MIGAPKFKMGYVTLATHLSGGVFRP